MNDVTKAAIAHNFYYIKIRQNCLQFVECLDNQIFNMLDSFIYIDAELWQY